MSQLPPSAPGLYETLRDDILSGRPRPEGLAALRFHGMFQGLVILLKTPTTSPPTLSSSTPPAWRRDSDFVRLLANLVLHTHPEVTHVC